MVRVKEVIVVEGRYDQNTLRQLVDATVLRTDGFHIFRDEALRDLLRRLAAERGLIVLTDSDGAGALIRAHLSSVIPPEQLKHAYVPDIYGKEKRKSSPSKEGKLGVEGMRPAVLLEALRRAGATMDDAAAPVEHGLTKTDFYRLGLSGGPDSAAKRLALQKRLGLPERMSANQLLSVLRLLTTKEELEALMNNPEVPPAR